MYFLDERHEHTFNEFVSKAEQCIYKPNQSTLRVLYILSASERIVQNIDHFFIFDGNYPLFEGIRNVSLSTGERYLVALAFNLYNGYRVEAVDLSPYALLSILDRDFVKVYQSALAV